MSIFDRMNQIENKMNALDNALSHKPGSPKANQVSQESAASFQNIIKSMTQNQRFNPQQVSAPMGAAGTAATNNDPREFDGIIKEASEKYNVDESLIRAVIRQESAFNPKATSYCGAQGMMQLMPETAKDLGVNDAYDARENIMGGTRYLSQLLSMFDGDMTKAVAGYNAGPGAVQEHGGIPPYRETQDYVTKVLGYYKENKG